MNERKYDLTDSIFYLLVTAFLIIAYFPSFSADFIGDDIGRIADIRPNITFLEMITGGLGDRPVLAASIWVDRFLLGMSPGLMRLETILLFGFMAVFMRRIIDLLTTRLHLGISNLWRDSIIILYCLHPLHTQALTHVVQRGIILSSLGGLIATYLLLKCRFDWKSFSWKLALLVWTISLLAKSNIASLPIFWVILATYMRTEKRNVLALGIFFLMLLLPVVNYTVGGFNTQEASQAATPLNYFLIQGEILLTYAKLIIIPIGLRFNHDINPPSIPLWWPGLALWIFYVGTLGLVLKFVRPRIIGIFFVGALLAFLPESSFFPIMHVIFEHRTLFPMAFMALGTIHFLGSRLFNKWAAITVVVLIATSVTISYRRNKEVQKFSSWAEIELSQSCNIEFMQLSLTYGLLSGKHYEEARRGLDHLAKCSTSTTMPSCLEALYNVSISPTLDLKGLNTLKQCVHSDLAWERASRRTINSLVAKKIHEAVPTELKACYTEDFFSAQLRYLKRYREKFQQEIGFYVTSAEMCLKSLENKISPEATFQKLKIRTIKRYHFGVPDLTLANDLAKAPDTEDYNYLRSLLETAPKL